MSKKNIPEDFENNLSDSDIQILGMDKENSSKRAFGKKRNIVAISIFAFIVIALLCGIVYLYTNTKRSSVDSYDTLVQKPDSSQRKSYIVVSEETVNDVPLLIYTPQNAHAKLSSGIPDRNDKAIIFAAEAAGIREDNSKILGDFVIAGKQLARGISKAGFCAFIGKEIVIGISKDNEVLQRCIDEGGYFFRQYPLVIKGQVIENTPKGKAIRRALAIRDEDLIIVESRSRESFYDFSQALADIGVSDAIYLIGGNSFGWYVNEQGESNIFGIYEESVSDMANYLIFE